MSFNPFQILNNYLQKDSEQANLRVVQIVIEVWILVLVCFCLLILSTVTDLHAQVKSNLPIRHILTFGEIEREYFIHKPQNFDSYKIYWLLVVAHGGGGNGRNYF